MPTDSNFKGFSLKNGASTGKIDMKESGDAGENQGWEQFRQKKPAPLA